MNVIKMIVSDIVQSVQDTVENAVKESLKILPVTNRTNVKYLAEKVNNKALVAKFERDNLKQHGPKDSLRIYGVNGPDDETNEDLIATTVEKYLRLILKFPKTTSPRMKTGRKATHTCKIRTS